MACAAVFPPPVHVRHTSNTRWELFPEQDTFAPQVVKAVQAVQAQIPLKQVVQSWDLGLEVALDPLAAGFGLDEPWLEGCQCLAPAAHTAHFTPLWSTSACMVLVQPKTWCWGLCRHERQEEHLGRSEVQSRFAAVLRAQSGWIPCDHTGGMNLFPKILLSFVLLSGGHQWLCQQLSSEGPYWSTLSSQSWFSCVTGQWQ